MAKDWVRTKRIIAEAAETLDRLKLSIGCTDCGYRKHPAALHFDHIDPATKRRELGWMDDRSQLVSRAKVERYIAHVLRYCEVRCANCHTERTMREKHHLARRGSTVTEMAALGQDSLFAS